MATKALKKRTKASKRPLAGTLQRLDMISDRAAKIVNEMMMLSTLTDALANELAGHMNHSLRQAKKEMRPVESRPTGRRIAD